MALGSHDMFIADVVNVRADTRNLNPETGKLELAEAIRWSMCTADIMSWEKNREIRMVSRKEVIMR